MAKLIKGKIHIYDIIVDEYREITLDDVTRMLDVMQAYGKLRTAFHEAHDLIMKGKPEIAT